MSWTSLQFFSFIIFLTGFGLGVLTVVLMTNQYRKYRHDGLLILTISAIFTAAAPFAHVGHLVFDDLEYEILVTNMSAVMISLLITGGYLYIIGLNRLTEVRPSYRIVSIAPIYLLGLILNATAIQHKYIDGEWFVVYSSDFSFYLFSSCVLFMQLDLFSMLYSLIKNTKMPAVKNIFSLAAMAFFTLVPLLILRKYVLLPQNIFMLSFSFFYLLITILITFFPLVFFSSSASPHFLIIYDSQSRNMIRQYTFIDQENEERSEHILSQLISFYDILNEKLFSDDIKQIHMTSLNYYFERSKNLNYILVLNKPSESFKMLLYELGGEIRKFINGEQKKPSLDHSDEIKLQHIDKSVEKVFIHQLNRLKLVKKDIDGNTHFQMMKYINNNKSMKVIFHPVRLSIIQILYENHTILRSKLRSVLQINSGILSRHLDTLSNAAYIEEETRFVNDMPRKEIFITQLGVKNYLSFKTQMRQIIN